MSLSSFLNTYLYYMNEAKIRLSQKEMELVINAEFILTKNGILEKVKDLLASLQVQQQHYLQSQSGKLADNILQSSPKISKGENYNGLPYLILDFPRIFSPAGIYAIRTMFWWGNFFSITLHLSKEYKNQHEYKLVATFKSLQEKGFYCCINEDEWEHHFQETNYKPLATLGNNDFENILRQKEFIKLANKIPLQQWDDAEEILLTSFKELIKILAD